MGSEGQRDSQRGRQREARDAGRKDSDSEDGGGEEGGRRRTDRENRSLSGWRRVGGGEHWNGRGDRSSGEG
jgi:hypothetical protein